MISLTFIHTISSFGGLILSKLNRAQNIRFTERKSEVLLEFQDNYGTAIKELNRRGIEVSLAMPEFHSVIVNMTDEEQRTLKLTNKPTAIQLATYIPNPLYLIR